jgi:hypothetical protein
VLNPADNNYVTMTGTVPATMPFAGTMTYFPPNDKMYIVTREGPNDLTARVFEVTLNRSDYTLTTVTEVTGMTGDISVGNETSWAYDTVNQVIGGGIVGGKLYDYNPLTKVWRSKVITSSSTTGKTVSSQIYHSLVYDPVDHVYIFITPSPYYGTWAFKYVP